jgi:hypothetical protein
MRVPGVIGAQIRADLWPQVKIIEIMVLSEI